MPEAIKDNRKKLRLSGTALKLIALVFMTMDHLHLFLSPYLPIPLWFRYLGRITAPIFVFLVAEGVKHTKKPLSYLFRLYMLSVAMSLINHYAFRGEVSNNIGATLFLIVALCLIFSAAKTVKGGARALWIALFFAALILPVLLRYFAADTVVAPVVNALFPSVNASEGGIFLVALGIGFYLMSSVPDAVVFFAVYCVGYFLITVIPDGFTAERLFFENYQWMQILALPFIALYSGERGRGLKYLFYAYYPLHVYALQLISMQLGGKL